MIVEFKTTVRESPLQQAQNLNKRTQRNKIKRHTPFPNLITSPIKSRLNSSWMWIQAGLIVISFDQASRRKIHFSPLKFQNIEWENLCKYEWCVLQSAYFSDPVPHTSGDRFNQLLVRLVEIIRMSSVSVVCHFESTIGAWHFLCGHHNHAYTLSSLACTSAPTHLSSLTLRSPLKFSLIFAS